MKRLFNAKNRLLISVLALVSILVIGGTMAYLFAATDLITNTFSPAELDTEIEENTTTQSKEVWVKNLGESPAFVRARILVSGVDSAKVEIVTTAPTAAPTDGKVVLFMPNFDKWQRTTGDNDTYGPYSDEFFYYLGSLSGKTVDASGKVVYHQTEPLLMAVYADPSMDPSDLTVTVVHESVLADLSVTEYTAENIEAVFNKA